MHQEAPAVAGGGCSLAASNASRRRATLRLISSATVLGCSAVRDLQAHVLDAEMRGDAVHASSGASSTRAGGHERCLPGLLAPRWMLIRPLDLGRSLGALAADLVGDSLKSQKSSAGACAASMAASML